MMMRTKITIGILVSVTLKVGDREEMGQVEVETMLLEVVLRFFNLCIMRQFEMLLLSLVWFLICGI